MKKFIQATKLYLKKPYYSLKTRRYRKFFANSPRSFQKMEKIFNFDCMVYAGNNCGFWKNITFRGGGSISFGDNCVVGDNSIFYACGNNSDGGIWIGNNVSIASNCTFYDSDHLFKKGVNINEQPLAISPIVIEDDVWLGTGCIVLRGSIIRKGAVVGAGALVKGEIPENAVVVGVPAKVIKYRE